jgi:hypothetical protein
MEIEHKRALRCLVLDKIRELTCFQLSELATSCDCHPFEMAEQFEIEVQRIEKLFCYPQYDD